MDEVKTYEKYMNYEDDDFFIIPNDCPILKEIEELDGEDVIDECGSKFANLDKRFIRKYGISYDDLISFHFHINRTQQELLDDIEFGIRCAEQKIEKLKNLNYKIKHGYF